MPKLIKDYQRTGEQRSIQYGQDQRSSKRGGFWTMAWEDLDLQRDLDALVRKGWIDENSWRRISISDAGIGWKDEMT